MIFGYLIADFVFTVFAYMFIPFCMFYKKSETFTLKYKRKFLIIYTIIIEICFLIIKIFANDNDNSAISFAPALLYFYINYKLWTRKNLKDNTNKANKINKKSKKIKKSKKFDKRLILCFCLLFCLLLSNVVFINKYYVFKGENIKLENNIEELTKKIDIYENASALTNNASMFLNNYVAIIPVGQDFYLNYSKWYKSNYSDTAFYIMSVNDAINRGYSDRYMSGVLTLDEYYELYK